MGDDGDGDFTAECEESWVPTYLFIYYIVGDPQWLTVSRYLFLLGVQ